MSEAIHPHNLRKEIGFIDGLTGLQKHLLHELLAHCDAEEFSLPPKAAKRESDFWSCLLYTSPSPRDGLLSRMPSSA